MEEILAGQAPATSIISLYGAFNEILLALGAKNLIAARTDSDVDLPEIARLPSIGTHMRPDPERIAAASPGLVLGLKGRHDSIEALNILRELGIPVIFLEMNDFPQLFEATRLLGKISGHEREATQLVEDWQARLDKLKESQPGGEKPKLFYEARYPNLLAAGANGIINAIIEAAGGENIVKVPRKLARISEEWLLSASPDLYIIQEGPMNPAPQPLEERANFRPLAGRTVIKVKEREFARPGPQSILAAEKLAQVIRQFQESASRDK